MLPYRFDKKFVFLLAIYRLLLLNLRHRKKLELAKLLERVPITVKETVEDPTAKINVLLQAYISQLRLEGVLPISGTSVQFQHSQLASCTGADSSFRVAQIFGPVTSRTGVNSNSRQHYLEVVSFSAEFEIIPIRRHEDVPLRRIYDRVPVKLDRTDFEAPHFKTFLLLHAHFSRLQLPPDLAADQVLVLEKALNLLSACVDVTSSNAWLNALGAMDLSQMRVQATWETDSPL